MAKRIGIFGWKTGANSFGITLPYYNLLTNFGTVIIIEPNAEIDPDLDLLVLPGGLDIPQQEYNKEKFNMNASNIDAVKFWFYDVVLPKYIAIRTPLFGICLGHQMMAVKMANGVLDPDMWHQTSPEDERSKLVHKVVAPNNARKPFDVNSLHHQAVIKVDPNLADVELFHDNGRLEKIHIEALSYKDYPAHSVQWHPEEIWDSYTFNAIRNLLQNGKTSRSE